MFLNAIELIYKKKY